MKSIEVLKGELVSARGLVKSLTVAIREQRVSSRVGRAEAIAARKAQVEVKRLARISALEARLTALRLKAHSPKAIKKANKKASPVKIIKAA